MNLSDGNLERLLKQRNNLQIIKEKNLELNVAYKDVHIRRRLKHTEELASGKVEYYIEFLTTNH